MALIFIGLITSTEPLAYQCFQICFFPPFLIVGWTKHVNVTHQGLLLVFTPAQLYLDMIWTTKIVQKAVEKAELEMKCHRQLWSKHEQLRDRTDEVIGLTR